MKKKITLDPNAINDIDVSKIEQQFLNKYRNEKVVKDLNLSIEEILQNSFKIKKAVDSYNNCLKSHDACANGGYHYVLYRDNKNIELKIEECPKEKQQQSFKKVINNYWFKDITAVDYSQKIKDDKYASILKEIKELIIGQKQNIYIYNEKNNFSSTLFGLTNELASEDVSIAFFNMIDFNTYATAITFDKGNNYFSFIDQLKKVDLLVLDEIGNEKFQRFINTSILYSIISYRSINKKPIVFISQYELKDLKKQYELGSTFKEKNNITHFVNKIIDVVNKKVYKI